MPLALSLVCRGYQCHSRLQLPVWQVDVKSTSYFQKVVITAGWLYRGRVPKWLALIPIDNKFSRKLSLVNHARLTKLKPKPETYYISGTMKPASLRIQSECGKIRTKKTPNANTQWISQWSYLVIDIHL